MLQIVDGRLYDTETAETILATENPTKTLYRTDKGNCFLLQGLTQDEIVPLSKGEAATFYVKHTDDDDATIRQRLAADFPTVKDA